jgi:Domain of unknown function (DUF4189)
MPKIIAFCVAVLVAVSAGAAWSGPASAEGALAIGLPRDTARDGIAFGFALKYRSRATAEAAALDKCRTFQDAPPQTRALCRLVESFSGRCLAIALDTKPGVHGEGWAIEYSLQAAEQIAIDQCRAIASPDRRQFCTIVVAQCDN